MDTYEENGLTPNPVPDETPQPLEPQEQSELTQAESIQQNLNENACTEKNEEEALSDGFYHGAGAGARETTIPFAKPTGEPENADSASLDEAASEPASNVKVRRNRKKIGKKVLKCAIAALLILALVFTGCGISVAVVNRYWQSYNQTLLQNFDQQIEVLRQELEAYKNETKDIVIVPSEGLTPSQIYDKNIASVVAVNCMIRTTNNGQVYEATSSGSGFVVSSDGYIVTNHHVIEGASSIIVVFANGSKWTAQLIGSDPTNDIALLKISVEGLQPVTIGSSSKLRVGDQVVAIGNALGELSFSLTVGHVSGTDRNISTDGSIMNMIQTDASINSGNSGGPLFNAKGEVVGITTSKYSGTTSSGAIIEGIGFAIPLDEVLGMLEDLRQYGYIKGAYLGVLVRDMDPAVAETYGFPMGAYVVEVTPGYAAEKCGIMAKDIITNVGGYDVDCMSDLTKALHKFSAGDSTTVSVWRSGRQIILKIVFDEKPRG